MPHFLISIHRPTGYNPALETAEMARAIDDLNDEMKAAGIRVFVGGLQPPATAKSLRPQTNGQIAVTDGLYLATSEFVGGFWVLNVANLDEAIAWGRKATVACRAPVEVRPFH